MISTNGADKEKRRKCMGAENERIQEWKKKRDKWECMCVNENEREMFKLGDCLFIVYTKAYVR